MEAKPKKKKQKTAGKPGAAATSGGAFAGGVSALFDRLERGNASFLTQASAASTDSEVARLLQQERAAEATALPAPAARGGGAAGGGLRLDAAEAARRRLRHERFAGLQDELQATAGPTLVEAAASAGGRARGTSTALEKQYLRLTSLPAAADVRPPAVLRQALAHVKRRWLEGAGYAHACEQLQSIRQDLTVQGVRGGLAVDAYQTHARLALEAADWAEFRRCHAVLRSLYADGTPGEAEEFNAYGVLLAASTGDARALAHEMLAATAGRQPGRGGGALAHALRAARAYAAGDYVGLLRCYEGAPRMAPYILDAMLQRARPRTYRTVLAAYSPSVPVAALAAWLGFPSPKAAVPFLLEAGGAGGRGQLDVKASRRRLRPQ